MKGLFRWLFLCLSLGLLSFSVIHLGVRSFSIHYFSSIDRVNSIFSSIGISAENFVFYWAGLNPVLKIEVAEHQFFRLENVLIEVGFWDSLLKNDLVLSRLRVDSGEIRSYEMKDTLNPIGLWNFGEVSEFLGFLTESKEVYIRLFLRVSEEPSSPAMSIFELTSRYQDGIQKLKM